MNQPGTIWLRATEPFVVSRRAVALLGPGVVLAPGDVLRCNGAGDVYVNNTRIGRAKTWSYARRGWLENVEIARDTTMPPEIQGRPAADPERQRWEALAALAGGDEAVAVNLPVLQDM